VPVVGPEGITTGLVGKTAGSVGEATGLIEANVGSVDCTMENVTVVALPARPVPRTGRCRHGVGPNPQGG
jgi:hypothetical protein